MKQFRAFIHKEFLHILRDRWTLVILLVLPVMMLLLFGYAISTEVKNTHLAVLDLSQDRVTHAIIEKFKANEYFTVDRALSSPDQIEPLFNRGEVRMVVVFSEGFAEAMQRGEGAQIMLITDGSDPNSAIAMNGYATAILNDYRQEQLSLTGMPYQINTEIKLLYNPTMKGAYNFVPGVMGMILMLICAMMTSISIAREKETGTMEVLLASPMRAGYIIFSKMIPYFLLSLVDLLTILLLSIYVLGVPVAGSLAALITLSLIYILVALSLGLLISSLVKTQQIALLISGMVLILPIIMLSGMMFPVENMPAALQWLSEIVPTKWYIIAVKKVMIKGLGFEAILGEMAVLGTMATVLLAIGIRKFRVRLE